MSEVFKGKFVTVVGDSKYGDGKYFGLKDVDGLIQADADQIGDLKKGDTVTVKVSQGKHGKVLEKIKVTEKAKSGGNGGGYSGKGKGGWGGGGKSSYNDPSRQASIVMQHSQEAARELLDFLIKHEAIKLPAAAKRQDFLLAELDVLTVRLAKQADGATALAAIQAKPEAAPEAEDADAKDEFDDEPAEEKADDAEFDDDFDDA